MKYFLAIALLVLMPWTAHAAGNTVTFTSVPPTETAALKSGDPILIYATIDNKTKDPITYTLSFTASQKTIGTKVTTIPGYTQQAASITWKLPAEATEVTASITTATDKNKKALSALVGTIGTVTISPVVEPTLPALTGVKGFFGKYVAMFESWRVRQAEYFTHLKAQSKQQAGETTINDVANYLQPDAPTAPGQVADTPKAMDDGYSKAYLTLLYASAGESFFGHKTSR